MADPTTATPTVSAPGVPGKLPALGASFEFQENATGPLGSVEKSYMNLMKTMGTFHKELSAHMQATSDSIGNAGDAADKSKRPVKEVESHFEQLNTALTHNLLSIKETGISWGTVLHILEGVTLGAAVVGVISFFKKAFKAAHEFSAEVAVLNEAYRMSSAQSATVSSSIMSLASSYGKTTKEASDMTRRMLELGLVPGRIDKLGSSFGRMSKEIADLSVSSGASISSVSDMVSELVQVNNLPAFKIRAIGTAIKSIADNSRMTADEVVNFTKSLDPLFAALSGKSGKSKSDFTINMMGLAGALSDAGVDATKATSHFADMLDVTSQTGTEALAKLAVFMNKPIDQLRDLVATNPARMMDEFSRSLTRLDPNKLKLMARELQPLGLEFVDLNKLREVALGNNKIFTSFEARAEEAAKAAMKEKSLADAAQATQDAYEKQIKRFERMWQSFLIKVGAPIEKALIPLLRDHLEPALLKLSTWVGNQNWSGFFEKTGEAAKALLKTLGFMYDVFVSLQNLVGESAGTRKAFSKEELGQLAVEAEVNRVAREEERKRWEKKFGKKTGGLIVEQTPTTAAEAAMQPTEEGFVVVGEAMDKQKELSSLKTLPLEPLVSKDAKGKAAKSAPRVKLSELLKGPGAESSTVLSYSASTSSIPSKLTTSSPTQEGLAREQLAATKETNRLLKARTASSPKKDFVIAITGSQ